MNRKNNYERMFLGENLEMPKAASRIDALWQAILNKEELPFEPVTRVEKYLAKMIDSSIETPNPTTRLEEILCAICNGEKVDEATKLSCKDEYLKYIYEQASGENMFVPNTKSTESGISYNGRTICFNGSAVGGWQAQIYNSLNLKVGDVVTLRYKYKSGSLTSSETRAVLIAPYTKAWATAEQVVLSSENYNQDIVIVTTITEIPTCFMVFAKQEGNTTFNNLTFEVSFEKGDTTQ